MKIFVTVCNENNITEAAKKLYISQPAVSAAIKEMEEYYNVHLFDRLSNKIYLTDVGKRVFDYAIHITSLFDELEETITNSDTTGTLRIGTSITIGTHLLPSYINKFNEEYPNIKTLITIDSSDIIEQMVLNNQLDFGLIEGVVHSNSLVFENFMEDELVVIASNDHRLSNKPFSVIDDLKKENFIMREKNSGTRELAESILLLHDFTLNPIWNSVSTEAIINAVAKGIGVSILPKRLVEPFVRENIIRILSIQDLKFKRQFHIIRHKNKYLTKASDDFFEILKNN
jgi:DNA-binding transcriptional LysR family regulator